MQKFVYLNLLVSRFVSRHFHFKCANEFTQVNTSIDMNVLFVATWSIAHHLRLHIGTNEMTTMIAEMYDVLKDVWVSDEKAFAASTGIANYKNRFTDIKTKLVVIKTERKLIKWFTGITLATIISLLIKTFAA